MNHSNTYGHTLRCDICYAKHRRGIVKSVMDVMEKLYGKEDYAYVASRKNNKVYVMISHFGKERFWTPKTIAKLRKIGLRLDHFESGGETSVIGEFNFE